MHEWYQPLQLRVDNNWLEQGKVEDRAFEEPELKLQETTLDGEIGTWINEIVEWALWERNAGILLSALAPGENSNFRKGEE